MIRAWLITITAVAVLVAGCSSGPEPTPQLMCTPGPVELGQTAPPPHECDREAWEKDQERLKLEKQAVVIHSNFDRDYTRLVWAGGSETLTPELEGYLAEPMRGSIQRLLARQKQDGRFVEGPRPKLTEKVIPNPHIDGSEVALKTCSDTRGAAMFWPDGEHAGNGRVYVAIRLLKHYPDGSLRLFYTDGDDEDSCPF